MNIKDKEIDPDQIVVRGKHESYPKRILPSTSELSYEELKNTLLTLDGKGKEYKKEVLMEIMRRHDSGTREDLSNYLATHSAIDTVTLIMGEGEDPLSALARLRKKLK